MSPPKSERQPARRSWLLGSLCLALALCAWLLRSTTPAWIARRFPALGGAVLTLLQGPIILGLLIAAGWQLRRSLHAGIQGTLGWLRAVEDRFAALLPARYAVWGRALLVGAGIGLLCNGLVELTPIEQGLEANILDRWFGLRFPLRSEAELLTQRSSSPRLSEVVVVGIDDETIAALGWPLPRSAYARLISLMTRARVRSLSFDVAIIEASREHPEQDLAIARATAGLHRVYYTLLLSPESLAQRAPPPPKQREVLASNLLPWHESAQALPDFSQISRRPLLPLLPVITIAAEAKGLAMANVLLDGDDLLRHSLTVARLGEQLFPSLSLRLAADDLGVPLSQVRVFPGSHIDLGGKRRIPIDELGRTLVRYQGRHSNRNGPLLYLSLQSLLNFDIAVTLQGSPMGEDQKFLLTEQSKLTVDGRPQAVATLDPALLRRAAGISGVARYAEEPGLVEELAIRTRDGAAPAGAPAAASAPDESSQFEVLDEERLRFQTRAGSVEPIGTGPDLLRDRHVLLGSTALAAADVHNGPLGGFPGVEHHATMLSNILRGDFFATAPLWLRLSETAACATLAALSGSIFSASVGAFLAALLGLSLLLATFLSFTAGLYIPMVAPASGLIISYSLCVFLSLRAEAQARASAEAGREFVRRTFGRYLTDQVVQQILDSPDGLRLGGQRRQVTILMTDLRGFTSMCGAMEPESVVALLNHYLETMTAIITRYGGTIDEFIGDAILVFFGAPLPHSDDELRAVACAIDMLNAMQDVNRWNREHSLPAVEMGIGIHSGELVVGNIGSEMRAKYGVVGAAINLTSRIESCTVGGQVLISESTRERCGPSLQVGKSQVITPKGVKGTLTIYEALAVGVPYEVELVKTDEARRPPAESLRVRYAVLRDKQVGELLSSASVLALSAHSMELELAAGATELQALANLQLRLEVSGGELSPGDIYAKVLEVSPSKPTAVLRITSLSVEAQARWDKLWAAAAGGPQKSATPVLLDGPLSSE